MKFAFRVDASLAMGTGHVMRCLTLARSLRKRGHDSLFIARNHTGNLNVLIRNEGFLLHELFMGSAQDADLQHSHWLGASQAEDVRACQARIWAWQPDWLVVDHYALDYRWETQVLPVGCRLLVIDDLADRCHNSDLLLDQNLGRRDEDYRFKVPENCMLLVGPSNALLRPDFASLRGASLMRREQSREIRNVLITMGGVDRLNHTGAILSALESCALPPDICFTVVLGTTAPHLQAVTDLSHRCPWPVKVLSGINNMAWYMANAQLAIGAAGVSSWERCCLGVPTLLIVAAENQLSGALALVATGSAMLIDNLKSLPEQFGIAFKDLGNPERLLRMGRSASKVTDGLGVERLIYIMENMK